MKIIENPPQGWMRNLKEGCEVWLTKERTVATVIAPFTPAVGGYRTGRLFIRKGWGPIDYWFVSENGKGIDGSTIMEPLEGSLPDTPALLQSPEAHELGLEIKRLREEVAALRSLITMSSLLSSVKFVRLDNSGSSSEIHEEDDSSEN